MDYAYCCFEAEDFADDLDRLDSTMPLHTTSRRSGGRCGPGLLRYPGGKTNVVGKIVSRLQTLFADLSPSAEYREPFVGSGAVAISFLKHQPGRPAWINDRDPAMSTLWDCVINRTGSLKMLVTVFSDIMDVNYFYYYKNHLRSIESPEDLQRFDPGWVALAKLAIHQMSYSGLGTSAGGPLGGRNQRGQTIRSRYSTELLCGKIGSCSEILSPILLRNGTCTCLDFEELFSPGEAAIYLDPPYYEAGPELYQHSFGHGDHVRLAGLLRSETRPWLLSYDRNPVILDLYTGWARIEEIEVPYSINGCEKKVELLISGS